MSNDDGFEYKSYRVHCTAKAISGGRFTADLMVTRVTPERLLERHFNHVASCSSKDEACECARKVGMAWIDAQQQMPSPIPTSTLTLHTVRVN